MEFNKGGSLLGATLLVAGTAIGGGMLALPILTAAGGFFPAVVMYALCWLFMASTGILLMEVYLWFDREVNIVSMSELTLGKLGKVAAWILYIFLFYSLTVAYVAGGGKLANDVLGSFAIAPKWLGPILFVLIFAPFVYIGAKAVDRINVIFMGGLILSFLAFVVSGINKIDLPNLLEFHWPLAMIALPVIFTSFGYQGMVPTLTTYLDRDPSRVKRAIFWGTAIPFVIYVIWEALILGIVPQQHLTEALKQGDTAVCPLKNILEFPWLYGIGQFFAFFAITTSFFGVTLGLLDFLADGFKIQKTWSKRFWLCLLIYLPPLIFVLFNPCIFLNALNYAGGLGCALLLGLLPILMVWSGRYRLKLKSLYSLPGGKPMLVLLFSFIVLELLIMIYKLFQNAS